MTGQTGQVSEDFYAPYKADGSLLSTLDSYAIFVSKLVMFRHVDSVVS